MNCIKRRKNTIPKDDSPRPEGVQYATGEEWRRTTNSPKENQTAGLKWKQHSVVDVSGDESKIWWGKEQYCLETWNVRSMNQGKLGMVKQEMVRIYIDIVGISEHLKWMGMGKFNSDDHYIYYCGQEIHRNGVALIINNKV